MTTDDSAAGHDRRNLAGLGSLVFASGFAGLVLQVAWFREFALVFGGSTAASAAVLAIFMGGLGAGSALWGARVDRQADPLRIYAHLALLVGLTGALSGYLIDASTSLYIHLGGQSTLGLGGATLVRLVLAAAVLAVPTVLMGGTLPAAAKAATRRADRQRRAAAMLYGMNTLGAVVGALTATFFLLAVLGTRTTLWLGGGVYVVTALVAYRLANVGGAASCAAGSLASRRCEDRCKPQPSSPKYVYATATTTGFTFFLMELVWYRLLGPILGGTTYTFGLILAIALLGIGAGGSLYPLVVRRLPVSVGVFGGCCAIQAMCTAFPLALGDRIALWAAELYNLGAGFFGTVLGWSAIASLVVLPAALVSGFQFPLLIALAGSGDEKIGAQVGRTCAANTAGAIAGSLAGGFGLLPWLTAPGAWRLVVVVLSILSGLALWLGRRQKQNRSGRLVSLAAIALALGFVAMPGPTAVWRHSGIGAGRFELPDSNSAAMRDWINGRRRAVLWEAEGAEASIALLADDGLAFWINGKCDGHAVKDAGTQIMLGLLGAALHPEPKMALVVGLGTGETPGWLAEVETIGRVDVVELEPAIAEMARRCAAVNHDAMNLPKVRLIYNDAREVLLTSPNRYDLIVSEPSNPYRAGIANLFTREFYQASLARLHERGVFVQWLQGYEVDWATVATTLATLRSVFGHVEVWQSRADDMLLVCSSRAFEFDSDDLRTRLASEPWKSALRCAWRATDLEGFLARYVAGPSLVDQIAEGPEARINCDDLNRVEYGFARTLGRRTTGFSIGELRDRAWAAGAHRLCLVGGAVSWERVADHRQLMVALAEGKVVLPRGATATQQARTKALGLYWAGDAAGMVETWQAAAYEPVYPTETALLALACAHLGDDRARPLIGRLSEFDPVEAEVMEALLHCRQEDYAAAAPKLESVLAELRKSPWCLSHALELLFPAVLETASRKPDETMRLYKALGEPFAVCLCEEDRLATAHALASLLGPQAMLETLIAYEPHVPWNERFLETRYRLYRETKHPLASRARRDWESVRSR